MAKMRNNTRKRGPPSRVPSPGTSSTPAKKQKKPIVFEAKQKLSPYVQIPARPMDSIIKIFAEIVDVAMKNGLADILNDRPNMRLFIATMCSGTESPIFALNMIASELLDRGVKFKYKHVFSAEIEPFKEQFIERNCHPPTLYRDITELPSGSG